MKSESVIKYTNKTRLSFFRNVTNIGNIALAEESIEDDAVRMREMPYHTNTGKIEKTSDALSEYDFYVMYLTILTTTNDVLNKLNELNSQYKLKPTLTPTHIIYLATLMTKSLDFTISTNSKSNKITEIAIEIGKTGQSFYNAINKLKKHNWIYITEDSNIKLQTKLENLRKIVKAQLETNDGIAIWDSLFRYTIQND